MGIPSLSNMSMKMQLGQNFYMGVEKIA
jgi:hypothetical protein